MTAISGQPPKSISKTLLQQKEEQNEKDLQRIMSLSKRETKELSKHCMICAAEINDACLYPNCCQGRRVMTRHALNTGKAQTLPIIRKISFDDSKSEEKGKKKRSNSSDRSISPIASLRSLVNSLRRNDNKSTKSKTMKKSDDEF